MQIELTNPNWRERIAERWRTVCHGIRKGALSFNDEGLTSTIFQHNGSRRTVQLSWSEVTGVLAYKRDIFTMDLICIALATADGTLEINENMEGWSPLIEVLPKYLPGSKSAAEWWKQVAFPPFLPNSTILLSPR